LQWDLAASDGAQAPPATAPMAHTGTTTTTTTNTSSTGLGSMKGPCLVLVIK
jgi:hypothetical protein